MNELYHHGTEGQRWGIRNGPPYPLDAAGKAAVREQRRDKSELASSKRRIGAAGRKLKEHGRIASEARTKYDETTKRLEKIENKPYFFNKAQKKKDILDTVRLIQQQEPIKNIRTKEYAIAKGVYDIEAKDYVKKVKAFDKKYGTTKLSEIKTKTINAGKMYAQDVIDAGVNLSMLPVVGDIYTESYYNKARRKYISDNPNLGI